MLYYRVKELIGILSLITDPAENVNIIINNEDKNEKIYEGAGPIKKNISTGSYVLKFSKDGYKKKILTETFTFSDKKREIEKRVTLQPERYKVEIFGTKGATVTIDGRNVGKIPLEYEVDFGIHSIGVEKNGYIGSGKEVNISKNVESTYSKPS